MTKGDLTALTVWGRPLKPVALGLTLTMVIVTQANIRGIDRGTAPPLSWLVALLSATAVITMLYGWFGRHQRAAEIGLLLVVGTYITRAAFIALESGPAEQAVWFSLATVVIAAGSYALEVDDRYRKQVGNG